MWITTLISSFVYIFGGILATVGAVFFLNIFIRVSRNGSSKINSAKKYSVNRQGKNATLQDVFLGKIDSGRNGKPDFAVQRTLSFAKKTGNLIPQGRLSDEIIDQI